MKLKKIKLEKKQMKLRETISKNPSKSMTFVRESMKIDENQRKAMKIT